MFWFLLILALSTGYAISSFIDNYVADVLFKKKLPEATKVFGIIGYFAMAVGLLIFAPPTAVPIGVIAIIVLSGIVDAFASIPYYRALKFEDTTGMTILQQMSPVLALILGYFVLGDIISPTQLVAFVLVMVAILCIILSNGKRKLKIEVKAAALSLLAILGWVISDVIFIGDAENIPFTTAFFWLVIGKLLTDTILAIVFKKWRRKAWRVFKEFKGKLVFAIAMNEIVYLGSEFVWRFAMLLSPLALAHVTADVAQLLITFILGIFLSVFWPKFGRERLKKKVVLAHLVAVIFAGVGVVLLHI